MMWGDITTVSLRMCFVTQKKNLCPVGRPSVPLLCPWTATYLLSVSMAVPVLDINGINTKGGLSCLASCTWLSVVQAPPRGGLRHCLTPQATVPLCGSGAHLVLMQLSRWFREKSLFFG